MSREILLILVMLAVLLGLGGAVGAVVFVAAGPADASGLADATPTLVDREIRGLVWGGTGPVAGAVVRVQGTDCSAKTGADGRFRLVVDEWQDGIGEIADSGGTVSLTAFAPGYYIAGPIHASPGQRVILFILHQHPTKDNPDYEWLSAVGGEDGSAAGACQDCHSDPAAARSLLPFDEWVRDAHGTSAVNRRFLSMYQGTDLTGEYRSPDTRYAYHRDYGKVPIRPAPDEPYYGPGFKLDFPEQAGDCAACHLPAAAANTPYETDPSQVIGVGREGVACDVCHKIWDVMLDPTTGLPRPNMPGVLSIEFRRPSGKHQLFIGPYDDVAPGEDTYSALQNESEICAPCHFGQFWGVQVYNSFGEWLDSPYSDPDTGQTCQDCHMPRRGATYIARPDKGGLERDPETIYSHLMPGAADVELLQNTAELELQVERSGDELFVEVWVTNYNAGHHIPTDHPARNILLVVTAVDSRLRPLEYLGDQVVPEWGGVGVGHDDYAGRPGKGYAKVLEELWTEVSPTAAYWRPTRVKEDTRIPALFTDVSSYRFRVPQDTSLVMVKAQLIFRRAFKSLAEEKVWDTPDILMELKWALVR